MEIQANFHYLAVVILLETTTDLKPAAFWDFINFFKKSFGQLFKNEKKAKIPNIHMQSETWKETGE